MKLNSKSETLNSKQTLNYKLETKVLFLKFRV